jgi:biopolymer transport protein TolQ
MDPIQTAATVSTDLSIWNLFMEADIIVKAVMLALVAVSFWCWAIIFDKLFRLRGLVRKAEQFEESFWSGGSLEELYDRIDRVMQVTMSREMEALEARLGFLASVGSTAPFIGLFGTVWGIMNAFHHIGETKNTSLAVVAPGIAEALFATALGLVAAIPAVLAYNKLSTDMDRYAKRLEGFAGEFGAILSRQLEEKV